MAYQIADAVLGLRYEELDQAVVEQAKRVFLYHLWTAFRGRRSENLNPSLGFSVIEGLGFSTGPCTVIGHDLKLNAVDAAYLNCHLIGGGGYDDVVFPAGMHAGLMVVPVAMAIAEQQRKSGRDFLASLVVGYEILGKIGRWTWSNENPRRPGPVFGPMATAGVAAQMLDLNQEQTATAIGYAAHGAMGLPCNLNTHLHALAVRTGIISAFYGKAGGVGPPGIIEGKLGFFQTFFGSVPSSSEGLLNGFGEDYAILRSREKRYAGTLLNLVAVEKMRVLVQAHQLTADNVESVSIQLSNQRQLHPTAQLRPPYRTPLEAFASCQFLIALLLLDGDIREEDRMASKDDPEVLEITKRVEISFVEHSNPIYASIEVKTPDGKSYTIEGEDHVFPPLNLHTQLNKHASDVLTSERIDSLVRAVDQLEEVDDISNVFAYLIPDK